MKKKYSMTDASPENLSVEHLLEWVCERGGTIEIACYRGRDVGAMLDDRQHTGKYNRRSTLTFWLRVGKDRVFSIKRVVDLFPAGFTKAPSPLTGELLVALAEIESKESIDSGSHP